MLIAPATTFLRTALVYNAAVFAVALAVYLLIDFKRHYSVDGEGGPKTPFGTRAYHAVMAHVAGGGNDVVPRTGTGRLLLASHSLLSWAQIMFVFLA